MNKQINKWMDKWPSVYEMRPNTWRQVMHICHYVLVDEETMIQVLKEGWGVRGYILECLLYLKLLLVALLLFFHNSGDDSILIRNISSQVPLWGQNHNWQHWWAGYKVQQNNQFSPRWNPWMVLYLSSESILENCHLSLPCYRNSTCHLPLKFLEVLLDILIGCHIGHIQNYFLRKLSSSFKTEHARKDRMTEDRHREMLSHIHLAWKHRTMIIFKKRNGKHANSQYMAWFKKQHLYTKLKAKYYIEHFWNTDIIFFQRKRHICWLVLSSRHFTTLALTTKLLPVTVLDSFPLNQSLGQLTSIQRIEDQYSDRLGWVTR